MEFAGSFFTIDLPVLRICIQQYSQYFIDLDKFSR